MLPFVPLRDICYSRRGPRCTLATQYRYVPVYLCHRCLHVIRETSLPWFCVRYHNCMSHLNFDETKSISAIRFKAGE